MLKEQNGALYEQNGNAMDMTSMLNQMALTQTGVSTSMGGQTTGSATFGYCWPQSTYWGSYPVYICTDKTKKAIEVLKCLQAEKLLKCDSVPRFIELVDKIASLL